MRQGTPHLSGDWETHVQRGCKNSCMFFSRNCLWLIMDASTGARQRVWDFSVLWQNTIFGPFQTNSKGRPRTEPHVFLWPLSYSCCTSYFHPDLKTQCAQTHSLLLRVNTDLEIPALIDYYLFLHDVYLKISCLIYYLFWWTLDPFDMLQTLIRDNIILSLGTARVQIPSQYSP